MVVKRVKAMQVQALYDFYERKIRPLTQDEGGGFVVTFPDLPGCMSDGATREEAIENGRDAFLTWVSARVDQGKSIPTPRGRTLDEILEGFGDDESIPWQVIFPDSHSGTVLRGFRYRNGWTQRETAERVGVSCRCVSEMERGKRPIDQVMARKLAKVFRTGYKVFLTAKKRDIGQEILDGIRAIKKGQGRRVVVQECVGCRRESRE